MIVDGRAIAEEIYKDLKEKIKRQKRTPILSAIAVEPDFATKRYLEIKKRAAERIDAVMNVIELPSNASTGDIVTALKAEIPKCNGVIVQLPLPERIDTQEVLRALPASHDVDVIGSEAHEKISAKGDAMSPVAGAIEEIVKRHHIDIKEKHAVVVGEGRLVGAPAAKLLSKRGAHVVVTNKDTESLEAYTKVADILVLGAGVPGLITPKMVKEGVVIFDAGTSEEAGKLVGDADPACADKASLFTPVPGGIGPITIAILFRNLTVLVSQKEKSVV